MNVNEDFNPTQPLILRADSSGFYYPNKCKAKSLTLGLFDPIRLACPKDNVIIFSNLNVAAPLGGNNVNPGDTGEVDIGNLDLSALGRFGASSNLGVSAVNLKCYGLTLFEVEGQDYLSPIERIGCGKVPVPEAELTEVACPSGRLARIGFSLGGGQFVPALEQVCFEEAVGRTHWVRSRVSRSVRGRQREVGPPPAYRTGPFFSNVPSLSMPGAVYSRDAQRARLLAILGVQATVDAYIPPNGEEWLIEGMLAPRSDMFYRAEQDSTFFYVNTVPIWRSVSQGNWRLVEDIVRNTAGQSCSDLDVWTGGIDTLALKDAQGELKMVTLASNAAGEDAVPVPRLLFKYVVDQSRNRGNVFITINDPRLQLVEDTLCPAQPGCAAAFPQLGRLDRGYTYCCSLADFATFAKQLGLPTYPSALPLF